jgi:hypothetical protein
MNETIYIKTRYDGLWEENPTLGCIIYGLLFFIPLLGIEWLLSILSIPILFDIIIGLVYLILFILIIISIIQSKYVSKSTAFIKRNNQLYAIRIDSVDESNRKGSYDREEPLTYSQALNNILVYLANYPGEYQILSNFKRDEVDNIFSVAFNNNALCNIKIGQSRYGFLILNNPKVVKVTKKHFIMEFYNEYNNICVAKFSNCYTGLIENIN